MLKYGHAHSVDSLALIPHFAHPGYKLLPKADQPLPGLLEKLALGLGLAIDTSHILEDFPLIRLKHSN